MTDSAKLRAVIFSRVHHIHMHIMTKLDGFYCDANGRGQGLGRPRNAPLRYYYMPNRVL